MELTHYVLFPWSNHVYLCNAIIVYIMPVFTILSCSHAAFCVNNCIVILVRLACFFVLPTIYLLLSLVIMFTHAYSRHVVTHALHSFSSPSKLQWSMKVCTTFLVAYVGYYGNNYKQTMIGFIHFFLLTMIESCISMVPNALLIKKGVVIRASCVSLMNMFVMHRINMPWCIHHISSMIGCWSIGHHNFHSCEHGIGPSIIF